MNRFRLHGLAAAIIALGGCASSPQNGTLEQQARFGGTTLADLESTDIIIEEQQLESASTQDALNSYRQAAELFDDPERRAKTLRRMADLALSSATEQEMGIDDADNERLEQRVDKVVYDNTMEQVNTTPDTERKLALLDLAGTMAPSLADQDVDYNTAISLYQELLDSTTDPDQRAEAYYLLSKAYAMDGNLEQARASLDSLVEQYPDSDGHWNPSSAGAKCCSQTAIMNMPSEPMQTSSDAAPTMNSITRRSTNAAGVITNWATTNRLRAVSLLCWII